MDNLELLSIANRIAKLNFNSKKDKLNRTKRHKGMEKTALTNDSNDTKYKF